VPLDIFAGGEAVNAQVQRLAQKEKQKRVLRRWAPQNDKVAREFAVRKADSLRE
jgi:hypothetical protein